MFGECNKLIQVQGRSVKFMGFSVFFTLGLVMDVMAWVCRGRESDNLCIYL